MKKTKLEKGITLIALIITIVILLILAVTTIATIQESDIIKYATDASSEHIIGQEKEQIQLAYNNYKMNKYAPKEKTEDQSMLEQYFLGKPLYTLFDETKTTDEMIVFKDIDIILTANDLKIVQPEDPILVHAFFEYKGCDYKLIINWDNDMMVESLETDENISLEIADAEVTGNEKIGWDVEFNDTGNKYYISKDGELGTRKWDMAWTSDGTTWSEEYTSLEEITEEYSVIAKLYKTGETLTYPNGEVCEEYHMTIEGNGEMAPLLSGGDLSTGEAWLKNINFQNASFKWFGVTKLTIGEGITNIPYGAFVFGIWLNDVTLPSTLTSIGKEAFEGCAQLTEITIPDSVESIGNKCFYGCEKLTTIHYNGVATGRPWSAGTSISF